MVTNNGILINIFIQHSIYVIISEGIIFCRWDLIWMNPMSQFMLAVFDGRQELTSGQMSRSNRKIFEAGKLKKGWVLVTEIVVCQ